MNNIEKGILGWSGGKDSAMALYELTQTGMMEVAALLTTVTEEYDRISMHGVRRELLLEQSESLGYPLEEIAIPQNCTNDIYEQRLQKMLEKYQKLGVSTIAFGDLFLEDIRRYREEHMHRIGMNAIFPIWKTNTEALAHKFTRLGFRACITCVDTDVLSQEFSGREYDEDFIQDLPADVDPCGENGEFHSFVYDGPIFRRPIRIKRGEKVLRNGRFYYCDLIIRPD